MARFNVVIPREDGGVEIYPMKEWLRRNPTHIPADMHPTNSNSHKLRDGLRRNGWSVHEAADEIRLMPPGDSGAEMTIANVLGGENTIEESDFSEIGFALESHLRDFIVKNLNTIDVQGRKLRLYTDGGGRSGVEFVTPAGIIDILTVDQDGAFFVFELKRSRSPDHAIGQLARYMGWLRQTFGAERAIHGLIVAKEITDNLRHAATVIPNVSLFEYEVQFQLKLAHEFPT